MRNIGQAKSLTHSNALGIALKCVRIDALSALKLLGLDSAETHTKPIRASKKLIRKSEARNVKRP